jgi:hypothetical protein
LTDHFVALNSKGIGDSQVWAYFVAEIKRRHVKALALLKAKAELMRQ